MPSNVRIKTVNSANPKKSLYEKRATKKYVALFGVLLLLWVYVHSVTGLLCSESPDVTGVAPVIYSADSAVSLDFVAVCAF